MRKAHISLTFLFPVLLSFFSCEKPEPKKHSSHQITIPKVDSTGKLSYDLAISKDSIHQEQAIKINAIFNKMARARAFNGTVLVAEDGKIIYENAFGYANYQTKQPLTIHSSFHLASVSKQFTAMAIMMLKEAGKLNYDDDIKKYIPEIPYNGVTIRNLLNHTSGVPNILNYIPNFILYWDSCQIASNSDVAYMLSKYKPSLSFKPGNRFSYNNTGYVLLALIVEKITGKPFSEFIEKRIFIPLRMDDSHIYSLVNEPIIKERAYGYGVRRSYYSLDEDDIRNGMTGEKGVYASAIDLFKWDQALYTNFLVKDSSLREAFSYSKLNNGRRVNYGFGWRKIKEDPQVVYHFGHWRGFKACIIRFTEDRKLIVILNNTGNRQIKYLANQIIKILYANEGRTPGI